MQHFIARLLLEKVLRTVVADPLAFDDPGWLSGDLKILVPDAARWQMVTTTLAFTFSNEQYLEPIDVDSLLYSLAKVYLKSDLDGQDLSGLDLIDVLAPYVQPTSAAVVAIDVAIASAQPAQQSYLQSQRATDNSINNKLRDMFALGQPISLPAPQKGGGVVHQPNADQSPGERAAELDALHDKIRRESIETTRMQVFFGTDRGAGEHVVGAKSLRGDKLRFGVCEVSIPKSHRLGVLESPSFMRLEFKRDSEKHVVLKATWDYSVNTFVEEVAASVSKSAAKDAFVFVHGYNVSFEDAARRTAQMAFDLNFIGAAIFYSWPSSGKIANYITDETNVTWSAPHFQEFLTLLYERSGAERIHVIAHSMGNRLICDAVKALSYDPANRLKLNHLVLAAPDIDADTFRELAAALNKVAGRVTVYESSKDKALAASKKLHGNPRAGEPFLIVPGIDAIDASAIDTNFLGHSYFSDNWPLLSDIHSILSKDDPPSARFALAKMQHADGVYYAFRA